MAVKPTIQLRTIFLIFVCAAIGLTCGTPHPEKVDPAVPTYLYEYRPHLNLYEALLYTGAAAMVFGLLHQIRDLARSKFAAASNVDSLRFARVFSSSWRVLLVVVLCVCTIARVLLSRKMIELPDSDVLVYQIFPNTLTLICVIVVLADSVERWRQEAMPVKERAWVTALAYVGGAVIVWRLLRETGLTHFLVHIATQGIEPAQPARFQRIGTFPDQQAEGFRLFWLSTAAAMLIAFAGAMLLVAIAARGKRKLVIASLVYYVCALILAATFCVWFYTKEFYRISPDFASVGFLGSWLDRLSGTFIAAILISVATYRLSRSKDASLSDSSVVYAANGQIALHEYALFLLLLLGAPLVYFYESLRQSFNDWDLRLGWQQQIGGVLAEYLSWPETYLMLAVCVLSIQLLWRRWKLRDAIPAWHLQPINGRRFIGNWVTLAVLAAVALPTLSIYSFTCWLGPWYVNGP